MKTKIISLLFLTIFAVNCGSPYNTEFPAPDPNKKLKDIYPQKINNVDYEPELLDFSKTEYPANSIYGSIARYGNSSIQILQFENDEILGDYFKNVIVKSLENYSTKFSGNINGKWSARGSNPGKLVAWQSQNWAFIITAETEEILDEIIEKFPYISKN